jgi:hypothetical protein
MTNEQQQSPIFRLDKLKKHLYNTIWGIKQLLTVANSLHPPCQLSAEGGTWWEDSSNYGKG